MSSFGCPLGSYLLLVLDSDSQAGLRVGVLPPWNLEVPTVLRGWCVGRGASTQGGRMSL